MCKCSNLLSLQSQFDKDLLQLLVDKVDAELLEAIPLPGEKTVQVVSYHPLSKSKFPLPSAALLNVQYLILVFASMGSVSVGCNRTHLEYLKSIDVKNPDAEFFVRFLDGFIYGLEETKGEYETRLFMSVRQQ